VASDLFQRMKRNPAGDWSIRDVEQLCEEFRASCRPPSGGGSHYKVSHVSHHEILTVPFRRPIKPVYIRKLIRFLESVGV
jgi:hypothetical protein